jgi:hypothetical protein
MLLVSGEIWKQIPLFYFVAAGNTLNILTVEVTVKLVFHDVGSKF